MKKKMLAVFTVMLLLVNCCPILVSATEFNEEECTQPKVVEIVSPQEFAMQQVESIQSDSSCPWDESTEIVSTITLYSLESNAPNGYIFNLKTRGTNAGYIQIFSVNDNYLIYSFSYDGTSELEAMQKYWSNSTLDYSSVYFVGALKYLVKDGNDNFIDLASNTKVELTRKTLESKANIYERHALDASVAPLEEDGLPYSASVTSTASSYTWPVMDDFSSKNIVYGGVTYDVTEHCTPTAATGILGALENAGISTGTGSNSEWTTFRELYISLNTNNIRYNDTSYSGNGTNRAKIASGIDNYVTDCGGSLTISKSTATSLSSLKSHINYGRYLLISVTDFDGTSGGHSIVATAYSGSSLLIQNGWSSKASYYPYSSLDIAQYVYIGE